jgi:hypothetical protein
MDKLQEKLRKHTKFTSIFKMRQRVLVFVTSYVTFQVGYHKKHTIGEHYEHHQKKSEVSIRLSGDLPIHELCHSPRVTPQKCP